MDVGNLRIVIDADVGGLRTGLATAKKGLKDVAKDAQKFGRELGDGLTSAGTSLGTLIAPLALLGGLAVNASIQFESAFSNVEKTVDGSEKELATLRDTLRDMATGDSPLASMDNALLTLTNIAAMGGSLGVAIDNLDEFVTTVALLDAASDDLDADAAAKFIGQFANVTKLPVDQWDNLADAIVKLGNGMATTEGQIAAFGNRLAPLANYKWEPDKIIAYSAALASLGVSPELGGTNLLKTVQDLTEAVALGGPKLQAFADAAGLSADEFSALANADPDGAFTKFIEGLSKMDADEQLATLRELGITSTEQITTIQRLAGGYDTLTQALGLAGEAWTKGGDALAEAAKKADTTQGSINELTNNVNDLLVSIGDKLTGQLGNVASGLVPIIDGIKSWVEANPELVGTIAAVTLGAAALAAGLTAAGIVVGAITTLFGAMATAVGLVSLPMVALVAAIGLLVATWNALGPGLVESWGAAFREIGTFISNLVGGIQDIINKLNEMAGILGLVTGGGVDAGGFDLAGGDRGALGMLDMGGQEHATGLANVPYDGYRAILHKNERVLTAHENRNYGSGGGVMINFNGGHFLGSRQEVIEWVREGMAEAGL